MNQVTTDIVFADSGANSAVNGARLNSFVADIALLNGAVLGQIEQTIPLPADTLLLGDSTAAATGVPKKIQVGNLLLESQRNGSQQFVATDTGTANAYAVALVPAATAYTGGMTVRFKVANANTGASTLNVNGIGAGTIKNESGGDLMPGDLLANQIAELVHDGTNFRLQSPSRVSLSSAQYAAATGSANAYTAAISPAPAAYFAGLTVRFKVVASNTGTSTLTVNALAAGTIKKPSGGNLVPGDLVVNQIAEVVHDGTNWQLMHARSSWDFISASLAMPGANTTTASAHGLGVQPSRVTARLRCITTDLGYSVGDEVDILTFMNTSTGPVGFTVSCDATNVYVTQDTSNNPFIINRTTPAGHVAITNAKWNLKVYASI